MLNKKGIVFLGPPGSGKGTQGNEITKRFNIPSFSTGFLLRELIKENNDLADEISEYVNNGYLIPDDLMNRLIMESFEKLDITNGFVLDGYPRTLNQCKFLDNFLLEKRLSLDIAINFEVSDEELIRRIEGRRYCNKCGAVYNMYNKKPDVENICDLCGSELTTREDDSSVIFKVRLSVYRKETEIIIDYYKTKGILKYLNAEQKAEYVFNDLIRLLENDNYKN